MNRTHKLRNSNHGRLLRLLLPALSLVLLAGRAQAQVTNQTDVKTWRIWEGVFETSQSYVNPSYDVQLQVTFTPPAGSGLSPIVVNGFWDGLNGTKNVFRARTAFPTAPGASPWVWTWTSTCTGGGCNTDAVLNQSTPLSVNVTPSTGGHVLFSHGFLKVNTSGSNAYRYLVNDDGTPFFWLGDTAWNASIRAKSALIGAPAQEWENYVADRKAKGFTVIQLALPVDYMSPPSGDQPTDAQGSSQTPFTQLSLSGRSCGTAIPNPCSQWNPAYWQNFEQKVRYANGQGLVVLVVGLAERIIESSASYPTTPDLQVNARNVVARLGGEFAIFSPGFDRAPGSTSLSSCTTGTNDMTCRIKFVGQQVKTTSSRHLVTNHFAGSMDVTLMDPFIDETWLDFELYQSGPGCNGSSLSDQILKVTNRARTMPIHLWSQTDLSGNPKPIVNGESIYDGAACANSLGGTNFTAHRARQTGYYSLLSGALGYTFGVEGIFNWGINAPTTTPTTGLARPSNGQMQTLCKAFRSLPAWQQLVSDPSLIANVTDPSTGSPWTDDLALVLARDVNNQFAVAYMPNAARNFTFKIETSGFSSFDTWTKEWIDPRSGAITTATCLRQGISTIYKCDAPTTPPSSGETADWVLRLGASPFTATTLCG